MSDLDEVVHEIWGMVAMMVRSASHPIHETEWRDSEGTVIRTGDVLEVWMSPDGSFHRTDPTPEILAVREVLVVHERDGRFYGVDYDILKGIELHEFAADCTVRGHAMDDEGLEYLRMGLGRFNGQGTADEEEGGPAVEFLDAQERHRQHPKTFEVPTPEELAGIKAGDLVKVSIGDLERFWVIVTGHEAQTITGTVDNDLLFTGRHHLKYPDVITFEERHVYVVDSRGKS